MKNASFVLQMDDGVWIDRKTPDDKLIRFKFTPYGYTEQQEAQKRALAAGNAGNKIEMAKHRVTLTKTLEECEEAEQYYEEVYSEFSEAAEQFSDEPMNRFRDWSSIEVPDPDDPKKGVPFPYTEDNFELAWQNLWFRKAFQSAFDYLLFGDNGRSAAEGNSSRSRKRGRARS